MCRIVVGVCSSWLLGILMALGGFSSGVIVDPSTFSVKNHKWLRSNYVRLRFTLLNWLGLMVFKNIKNGRNSKKGNTNLPECHRIWTTLYMDFFKTVYFSLAVANARPCQHKCLGQVSGNGFQFSHKSSQVKSKRVWFGSRVVSKHPVVIESIQQLRKILCTLAQS